MPDLSQSPGHRGLCCLRSSLDQLPDGYRAALLRLSEGLERNAGFTLPHLAALLGMTEPRLSHASMGLSFSFLGVIPASIQGIPFFLLLVELHAALSGILVSPRHQSALCRRLCLTPRDLQRARLSLGVLLTAASPRPAPAFPPTRSLDA